MRNRRRPTQQTRLARSFGGRSGMVSEELDRGDRPPEELSRAERTAARLLWIESGNHFEDYVDDDRWRLHRLRPSVDLLVAALVVVVVFGGYLGFIALLALTR